MDSKTQSLLKNDNFKMFYHFLKKENKTFICYKYHLKLDAYSVDHILNIISSLGTWSAIEGGRQFFVPIHKKWIKYCWFNNICSKDCIKKYLYGWGIDVIFNNYTEEEFDILLTKIN